MNVIVRRAGRRDLEQIHELWRVLRSLEAAADPRLAPSKDEDEIISKHREVILADPRTGLFVAEEGARTVGYVLSQIEIDEPVRSPSRVGRIVELIVLEEHRRKRIGSRLLECAKEWLSSRGLTDYTADLPILLPDARRFLERAGATEFRITLRASTTSALAAG